jgi:hypothetical protein
MTEQEQPQKSSFEEVRKSLGPMLFNETWCLIDKKDRSPEEDDLMVHCAHASRYFWQEFGGPLEYARGDWLVSHVNAILGRGEGALHFAKSYLAYCEKGDCMLFDNAAAHTAMARAYAAAGDRENCLFHVEKARELGEKIPVEEARNMHFQQLEEGPWFGMRDDP